MDIGDILQEGFILLYFLFISNYELFAKLIDIIVPWSMLRLIGTFLSLFIRYSILFIIAPPLILVYLLSEVVPRLGFVQVTNIVTSIIDFVFGIESFHDIRADLLGILVEKESDSLTEGSPENLSQKLARFREEAIRKHEHGEFLLSFLAGFLILLINWNRIPLSIPLSIGRVIQFYLLLMSISVIFRSVFIDILTYPPDYEFEDGETAEMALTWQEFILEFPLLQVGFILIGVIRLLDSASYPMAIQILDEWLNGDLNKADIPLRAYELKSS